MSLFSDRLSKCWHEGVLHNLEKRKRNHALFFKIMQHTLGLGNTYP